MLGALIGAGASIIGGMMQSSSAKKMAKAADPFGRYRKFYGEELKGLWQDPSSIYQNPAFISARDQGMENVMRKMAASGFLDSGMMATGLMDYSMGFGLDWLREQEQFLAMLAGAGITPNQGPAAYMQNAGLGSIGGGIGMLGSVLGGVLGGGGGGFTSGTWAPGAANLPGGGSISPNLPMIFGGGG